MGQGARRPRTVKTKRLAWVIVGLLAVAVVAVAVPLAEPAWWWVMPRRVPVVINRPSPVRGFRTVKRSSPGEQHGLTRLWFLQSGLMESETWYEAGLWVRMTEWGIDGAVTRQCATTGADVEKRFEPPWWWNAQPQTHPTAPWWKAEGR